MSERVHVVVRIRPFIASDPPDAELNTLVLDPTHVSVGKSRVFKADRVYMMEDATEVIYSESVAPLIRRFLRGFNASVLAYGQTGTGKTFTVQSLLPLLLTDIIADKALRSGATGSPIVGTSTAPTSTAPLLYLQYVEVYGETIRDLLDGSAPAVSCRDGEEHNKIRLVTTTVPGTRAATPPPERLGRQLSPIDERDVAASPTTGCVLVGATIVPIFTMAEAAELITRGDTRRATGSTNVHAHSSRSHAILTLFHARYACRLDVVDLAGSEREKKTGNVGLRFQESIAINTGLLALGNVMRALSRINRAANGKEAGPGGAGGHHPRTQHVPYRSSRLTRLLQDTLGGNSATVLIACVAPDTYNRDETLRTLQYCSLALRILNEPLQQYERLRQVQSPLGRRRGHSVGTVSPLSLREGSHTTAAATRAYRDDNEADDPKMAQLKVLELQSAYASLQQQYDEQAEMIASMCASHATTKERLALCEQELRKDEGIFTQQIRAMQELVCENQQLRRRLAKACTVSTTTTTAEAAVTRCDKASMTCDPFSRNGVDRMDAVRNMRMAGESDASSRMDVSWPLATSKSQDHQQHSAPEAATAAPRVPLSVHSPRRPQEVRNGVTGVNQYVPLEELPLAVTHQVGVRVDDGRSGANAPAYPATEASAEASHAADGIPPGAAAALAAAEPAQSFIRYILGLHGIHADAEQADGANGGDRRGPLRAVPTMAATSLESSIRKSTATSVGKGPRGPSEVLRTPPGSNPDDTTQQEGAPLLLDDVLARRTDQLTAVLPPQTMEGLSEGEHGSGKWLRDHRGCSTDGAQQDSSAVLLLAAEVLLRHQGANAELRNQVQVLRAELDGKQREAALLRLELQELKELFTADPNSAVTAQGGGAAAAAAVQETQLRRRLTEVEMRLRDMDEEERRIGVLQEQEIAKLECDNAKLRERLEEIRMEECMPPAEAHAFQDDTKRQLTGGAPASRAKSKLLGSTTFKYQHAKAEVERRRRECAQAERQLTDSRTRLADLRKARKELKGQSVSAEISAALRVAAADNYRERIYERLRGLEEQVAREQERFNSIVTEAKQARSDIDALLVSQTSNEKTNQYWCDALLGKRREMAYLIEICNLLCEEREQVVAELTEVQARLAQESDQYEAVFDELEGVQDENAKAQASNREQLDELRRLIAQTRAEREALEKENRDAKISMERQRCRTVCQRLNNEANQDSSAVGEECSIATAGDAKHAGEACVAELRTSESASLLDGDQQQMRIFEDYYRKLSAIVQSDVIEDVAAFMDTAADERFKVFDEVHAIERNMGALEAEKASLMAQLGRGGSVGPAAVSESEQQWFPPAVLATLSEAGTLDTLPMAKDAMKAGNSGCSSVLGASRDDTQERCRRMVDLLDDLGTTRDLTFENQEGQEASAAVLAQVVAQVQEVFCGLGCSVGELRALTGMEGVHPTTLLQCLAMIEQRASEYLLAYSRQQQKRLLQAEGAVAALPSRNAARTLLRRSDLTPKTRRNVVAATVRQQALPRSTDPTRNSTIAALSCDTSGTLDDRVEERPGSMAELKKVVEAKRILS